MRGAGAGCQPFCGPAGAAGGAYAGAPPVICVNQDGSGSSPGRAPACPCAVGPAEPGRQRLLVDERRGGHAVARVARSVGRSARRRRIHPRRQALVVISLCGALSAHLSAHTRIRRRWIRRRRATWRVCPRAKSLLPVIGSGRILVRGVRVGSIGSGPIRACARLRVALARRLGQPGGKRRLVEGIRWTLLWPWLLSLWISALLIVLLRITAHGWLPVALPSAWHGWNRPPRVGLSERGRRANWRAAIAAAQPRGQRVLIDQASPRHRAWTGGWTIAIWRAER